MQLLRDNLTLWTSSEGGEAEAGQSADAPKDAEKTAESTEVKPEASTTETETKAEEAPAAAS